MRKGMIGIAAIALICGLCLGSCESNISMLQDKYQIGTPIDAISSEQQNNSTFFDYPPYSFWNEGGYDVVAHFDSSDAVDRIQIAESVIPTEESFAKIATGDEVFTIVSLIGIPYTVFGSFGAALGFKINEQIYAVFLYADGDALCVDFTKLMN